MPQLTPEESANRRNILRVERSIEAEINRVIERVFKSAGGLKLVNDTWNLKDHPAFLKKLTEALKDFRINVEATLVNGIKDSFELSQKNLINAVYRKYDGRTIIDPIKAALSQSYDRPMNAFLNRTVDGLNLSDRVWNLSYQLQREIEWTIFAGLSEGQSAQTMARSMKRFLRNPDALYRRVRNAKGKLVLSKPAKAFKPGQGVYRSAYKNAMRVARTEVNTAYRTADHDNYKNKPYVLGIEVRLSDAHPRYDMCDELKGTYPAWFKFVGWHPQCICFTVPIMPSKAEWLKYEAAIDAGTSKEFVFKDKVTKIPDNAVRWMEDNKERIQGWKSEPWFIRDNKELRALLD